MDQLNPIGESLVDFFTKLSYLEIIALLFLAHFVVYVPLKIAIIWLCNHCSNVPSRVLRPQSENNYAVITGATDGIGLEFARQLAEKGFNLLLMSRTEEKLIRVGEAIQEQFPQCQKVDHLAVDFNRIDIYDQIHSKIHTLPGRVHILVNNVGIFNAKPDLFADLPPNYNANVVTCNIMSMTQMSEIVLKKMVTQIDDQKDGKKNKCARVGLNGVIINVSSFLGRTEIPWYASYGACKFRVVI